MLRKGDPSVWLIRTFKEIFAILDKHFELVVVVSNLLCVGYKIVILGVSQPLAVCNNLFLYSMLIAYVLEQTLSQDKVYPTLFTLSLNASLLAFQQRVSFDFAFPYQIRPYCSSCLVLLNAYNIPALAFDSTNGDAIMLFVDFNKSDLKGSFLGDGLPTVEVTISKQLSYCYL